MPSVYDRKGFDLVEAERVRPSEAVEIVSKIVEQFPQFRDKIGDGYIGAVANVLASYPAIVARAAHDPVRGVPSVCHFLPVPADVIVWCKGEDRRWRRKYLELMSEQIRSDLERRRRA